MSVKMAALRLEPERQQSDDELIEQTLAGDGAAYGVLVERYQRRIYRVVFAILRDEMEADTVTQDTFVQAFMKLSGFQGRSGIETWLTRIAINKARDSLRARRWVSLSSSGDSGQDRAILEPVDENPDAERLAISRQLRDAIERAVKSLSAQQKIIFRLRHYENLPLEEIARMLGLRSGTVRAHLFRAVRRIRAELGDWSPPGESTEGTTP